TWGLRSHGEGGRLHANPSLGRTLSFTVTYRLRDRGSGWHVTCPPHRANGGPMLNPIWLLSLATTPIGGPSTPPLAVEYRPRAQAWPDRGDRPYPSGQGARPPLPPHPAAVPTSARS